jgi:hypothetical protein
MLLRENPAPAPRHRLRRAVFLDVDGVLNTTDPREPSDPGYINPRLLKALARVVTEAQAFVVVSSTWRQDPLLMKKLIGSLEGAGVPRSDVVGCTKVLREPVSRLKPGISITKQMDAQLRTMGLTRGKEILTWLQEYTKAHGKQSLESWIAIDDMDLGVCRQVKEVRRQTPPPLWRPPPRALDAWHVRPPASLAAAPLPLLAAVSLPRSLPPHCPPRCPPLGLNSSISCALTSARA